MNDDTDEFSALEAALAFIDSYQASESATDIFENVADPVQSRKRRNAQAARKCHRKKRQELLSLRQQAQELQVQLDAIRDHQKAPRGSSEHFLQLMQQRSMLQKAEMTNKKLRAAVEKQRVVVSTVSSTLQKRLNIEDMQELLKGPGGSAMKMRAFPFVGDLSAILQELALSVRELQEGMDPGFGLDRVSCEEALTSCIRTKQHAQLGTVVEMTTTTPVARRMEVGWQMFNEALSSLLGCTQSSSGDTYSSKARCVDGNTIEKEFVFTVEDNQRLGAVSVGGISLIREINHDNYSVYVYSSMVRPLGGGVQFREQGWFAVTRSASDPAHRSIFHKHYQLYADADFKTHARDDIALGSSSSLNYLKTFLMRSLTSKIQAEHRKIDEVLVKLFGNTLPHAV